MQGFEDLLVWDIAPGCGFSSDRLYNRRAYPFSYSVPDPGGVISLDQPAELEYSAFHLAPGDKAGFRVFLARTLALGSKCNQYDNPDVRSFNLCVSY